MLHPGVGLMDQSEVTNFIKESPVGVLALVDGDKPYAVPVEYQIDDKTLIFGTRPRKGRKTKCIEKNPNACFVIYEYRRKKANQCTPCRSVMIEGRLTMEEKTNDPFRLYKMNMGKIGNWKCPPSQFAGCSIWTEK